MTCREIGKIIAEDVAALVAVAVTLTAVPGDQHAHIVILEKSVLAHIAAQDKSLLAHITAPDKSLLAHIAAPDKSVLAHIAAPEKRALACDVTPRITAYGRVIIQANRVLPLGATLPRIAVVDAAAAANRS